MATLNVMTEQTPKDIPLPKDFNRNIPIEVQTTTGIVQLFPCNLTRGTGSKKFGITIRGICTSNVQPLSQCSVYYKNTGYNGHFSSVTKLDKLRQVAFEAIIPVPEYWEES
ncbi:MAG TPA: hypothetical protein VKV04_01535 [Verrucomicrobiae bacterium]|nr:hypothetical protein [Verrucomicrobiae bacterium]